MRIVGIAGSLRAGSFNAALLRAAVEECPPQATIEIESIRGIPLPFDASGRLVDDAIRARLRKYLEGFVEFVA